MHEPLHCHYYFQSYLDLTTTTSSPTRTRPPRSAQHHPQWPPSRVPRSSATPSKRPAPSPRAPSARSRQSQAGPRHYGPQPSPRNSLAPPASPLSTPPRDARSCPCCRKKSSAPQTTRCRCPTPTTPTGATTGVSRGKRERCMGEGEGSKARRVATRNRRRD